MTTRLAHCTPTLGGHSLLCDRDGTYCALDASHDGPCKPHGPRRGDICPLCGCIHWRLCYAPHAHDANGCPDDGLDCHPSTGR
jgi:hypothetical protein